MVKYWPGRDLLLGLICLFHPNLKIMPVKPKIIVFALLQGAICFSGKAQDRWKEIATRPTTLDLKPGIMDLKAGPFRLKLVKSSQTTAGLQPEGEVGFDYTPADWLEKRGKDGFYHLGDLNLQLRTKASLSWQKFSTASQRHEIKTLTALGDTLAAADLSATLAQNLPLNVRRYWIKDQNSLVMLFRISNISIDPVEVGALGIPMVFNNILEGKSLEETHAGNVFYDPYIGRDAGYVQVTRLTGKGPAMLVLPYGKTPLEAYSPLLDDPTPRGIAFEGFHEWMVYSKARTEQDWKGAEQWNEARSVVLKAGETRVYGLKFILADSIGGIETKLVEEHRPVAIGVPGYILPMDVHAKLFLKYPGQIKEIKVMPQGALQWQRKGNSAEGWTTYEVKGKKWGNARLTLTYQDGLEQTISYKVIKPETELIADYGHFLTREQWFEEPHDLFKRSPSVISYDYEKKEQVKQDSRVWISGLSDEGGAGGWLGAMMKQLVQPNALEVRKLQRFADSTLWGGLQVKDGREKYGVKKSLFYYQPDSVPAGTYSPDINYKTWAAWNHKAANDVGRSYNYPHVAAADWVLYRLARNHQGLVTGRDWKWYLDLAFHTSMAMVSLAPTYAEFGQMEGTVFLLILRDLKDEGLVLQADLLEKAMRSRADHWRSLKYPFGSEMPWDSTGQEEVYMWSDYFGYTDKADVTLNAILGYMPTLPSWGYNGSARRYWDFLYGGKLSRIERQLHHYGSGLNAIPVLKAFRSRPDDLHLLRVGYGGLMGAIGNITYDGFGPAAFHSFPSTMKIDGLSGDYGSGFFGYAVNSGTYLTEDNKLGWLAFGGNLEVKKSLVHVEITTASKSRVYIAPIGLWLVLDAGTFKSVSYDVQSRAVEVELNPADKYTAHAYLSIESSVASTVVYGLQDVFETERNKFKIPLKNGILKLKIGPR